MSVVSFCPRFMALRGCGDGPRLLAISQVFVVWPHSTAHKPREGEREPHYRHTQLSLGWSERLCQPTTCKRRPRCARVVLLRCVCHFSNSLCQCFCSETVWCVPCLARRRCSGFTINYLCKKGGGKLGALARGTPTWEGSHRTHSRVIPIALNASWSQHYDPQYQPVAP